jgi:molybdenum cofactor cytidylyltransferase
VTASGLVAILLASGRGSRFDPSGLKNKLCHRLRDGRTVFETSAANLLAAGLKVTVVAPDGSPLYAAAGRLSIDWCVNPKPDEGMGNSIAVGVEHSGDASGWIVALGDMPFIKPATISAVGQAILAGALIAAPEFESIRGHPVAFGRQMRDELLQLSGDEGGKSLLMRYTITAVPTDDFGILRDIDRPEDLPV